MPDSALSTDSYRLLGGFLCLVLAAVYAAARASFPRDFAEAQRSWLYGLLLHASGMLLAASANGQRTLDLLAALASVLGVTAFWRALQLTARRPDRPWLLLPAALLPPAWWLAGSDAQADGIAALAEAAVLAGCLSVLRNRRAGPEHAGRRVLLAVLAVALLVAFWRGMVGLIDISDPDSPRAAAYMAAVAGLLSAAFPAAASLAYLQHCLDKLSRRFDRAAALDYLTGALNRRSLAAAGDRAVAAARRHPEGGHCAVLMADLDHFKRVNDRFGQAVGDRLLQHAAQLMNDGARQGDLLGRWGGEEFAMLLEGAGPEAARNAAERLRSALEQQPLRHDGEAVPITVSVGLALLQPTDRDFDDLLRRADRAMLQAKSAGRNQVVVAA